MDKIKDPHVMITGGNLLGLVLLFFYTKNELEKKTIENEQMKKEIEKIKQQLEAHNTKSNRVENDIKYIKKNLKEGMEDIIYRQRENENTITDMRGVLKESGIKINEIKKVKTLDSDRINSSYDRFMDKKKYHKDKCDSTDEEMDDLLSRTASKY